MALAEQGKTLVIGDKERAPYQRGDDTTVEMIQGLPEPKTSAHVQWEALDST
jgi:hypothetical protein